MPPHPRHKSSLVIIGLLLPAALLWCVPSAPAQSQPPINIIFDMHADPLPQSAYPDKLNYYTMQLDNGNWVLDQTAPLGVEISFLACGEFMEFVVQQGSAGSGAAFLQRIYASGEQIASHSHSEYRNGAFDWPSFPPGATYLQSKQSWQDNIDWVNSAITTALGFPPPKPLEEINAVKGAHLPKTEAEYHDMMRDFGLEVRQGGAEEDFYGIYDHYIMNPFRPSVDNYMSEDLSGAFVAVPQGAVIGKDGIHHNVFQDMTAPNVKRIFIQTYLNWRYGDRHGLPEKVWAFGWGSHNHDYQPGSQTRSDMVEMINWLDQNFVGKADATGSVMANWGTQAGTAGEYFAWETAHPGVSSFDSNGTHLDWDDYQYLQAVCEELWNTHHVADLDPGSGIKAWHLARGPLDVVVAFCDSGTVPLDLSTIVATPCRVVGAETGVLLGIDPSNVLVGVEPVIVTAAAPTMSLQGTPAIGQTIRFTIRGEPDAQGLIFASTSPAFINSPHLGWIQISPDSSLKTLGKGIMQNGSFTQPVTIPFNPSLVGKKFYIQGLENRDNGMTLTIDSLEVTIQ